MQMNHSQTTASRSALPIQADLPIATAALPHAYTAAKTALANCASIDECKSWSDKMQALASYARQADDKTLLKMVHRIQGRAVRRCGELSRYFDGRNGQNLPTKREGDHTFSPSRKQAAHDAGLSDHQRKQAVRVANVPEAEFEAAVESDNPPTVTKLAEMAKKTNGAVGTKDFVPPEGFEQATRLLGTIRSFAEFCAETNPETVAGSLMPNEIAKARRTIGVIDSLLDRFVINLEGPIEGLPQSA